MNDIIHLTNQKDVIALFGQELDSLGIGGDSVNPQSLINYIDGLSGFDEFLGGMKFENTNCYSYVFAFEKGITLLLEGANNEFGKVSLWKDEIESIVAYHNQAIKVPKRGVLINLMKTGAAGLFWTAVGNISDSLIKRVKPCKSRDATGSIYEFRVKSREGESFVFRMSSLKENKHLVSKFFDKHLQTSLATKDDRRLTCYIATVCYTDPFSPEVIRFREFRDKVLNKYWAGQKFINIYYKVSPWISDKLYSRPFLKSLTKSLLNCIYRVIK